MKKNKDVPDSAIIKQLLVEIGKWKSEVAHLEEVIRQKDEAIEAFKKWQSGVADYNYKYWLHQGLTMKLTMPTDEELHLLRSTLANSDNYHKWFKKLLRAANNFQKNQGKLIENERKKHNDAGTE